MLSVTATPNTKETQPVNRPATVDCDVTVTVLTFYYGARGVSRRVVPGLRSNPQAVALVRHATRWAFALSDAARAFGLPPTDWAIDIQEVTL